jgi:hypothetical protein
VKQRGGREIKEGGSIPEAIITLEDNLKLVPVLMRSMEKHTKDLQGKKQWLEASLSTMDEYIQ